MFRRALIGYDTGSVELLLERLEREHLQLLRESEAILRRAEGANRQLAEELRRLRLCLEEASEMRSRLEQHREAFERLLSACGDWCDGEIAGIREREREKELSLAKCDEAIAAREAGLDDLRRMLAEELGRLVGEAKRRLGSAGEEGIAAISPLFEGQKAGRAAPVFPVEGSDGSLAPRGPSESRRDLTADERPAAESSSPSPRVVVVDDDPAICSIVRLVMEREGYEVEELGDGRAAIDYIEKNPPCALVIVDLMLPFVDGLQIVRKIRSTPGWDGVPVLVLSSNSSEQQVIDLFRAGANEYVTKPFSTLELAARARRLLQRR
ncbi:MAG: response regulator [Thermacetogeniaceae bacterium]